MNKNDKQCLFMFLACGDGIGMECLTLSNEEFFFSLMHFVLDVLVHLGQFPLKVQVGVEVKIPARKEKVVFS